jgi:Ca2+-binding EF-hand superfamily protein
MNKEAMKFVYFDEIKRSNEILQKKFIKLDPKNTGFITPKELKSTLLASNMITPKEINVLIRNIKEDHFEYVKFPDVIFDVRFELVKSRLLDTNMGVLAEHFITEFKKFDEKDTEKISVTDLKSVLLKSKKINLTPFQVNNLTNIYRSNHYLDIPTQTNTE